MVFKRKATDSSVKDTKKLKAGGDIRNFFSSQGSSPPRRMTQQDSAPRAPEKEAKKENDKPTEKGESEKDQKKNVAEKNNGTNDLGDNTKTPTKPVRHMLEKAVEEAKDVVPTLQKTITELSPEVTEDSKKVEEKSEEKPTKTSEEPLSREEEAEKPKFDREAWAEKNLSAEERELLGLEIQTLDPSWFEVLKNELKSKSFLDLKRFLMSEHKIGKLIFPPAEDVYSW